MTLPFDPTRIVDEALLAEGLSVAGEPRDESGFLADDAEAVATPTALVPSPETIGGGLDVDTGALDAYGVELEAEPVDPEEERELATRALIALFGSSCPLVKQMDGHEATDADWVAWAESLWEQHRPGVQPRLYLAERNRLFRRGEQWLAPVASGRWVEPPRPRDAARLVCNLVQPALDQRLQILVEQRPGFRTNPSSQDQVAQKRAEAQQIALEYQYDEQDMRAVLREAAYWAQTDGVSFLCLYWDDDAGPWFEAGGESAKLGDIRTMVYRIEQVRVSANATSTRAPHYWVVRETMPEAEAVALYGAGVLDTGAGHATDDRLGTHATRHGIELYGADALHRDQRTVDKFTVYCEPCEYLPGGLMLVTVGHTVVAESDLPFGCVPLVRLTDGSSDPAFYPEPIMESWLPHQQRVNALVSKWVESIRRNSDGRLIAPQGAIKGETLVGGMLSVIETNGASALQNVIQPLQGFSVGNDTKEALQFEITQFEHKSGWNDASRGSAAADTSGRSILAQREILERTFAPPVEAAANALSRWGELCLKMMAWGYTVPRTLAVVGDGRPDLAREVSAEDFDGVSEVHVDPETLMPLPRSLRLFLLDQMYDKQQLTAAEYRRRMPFASVRSITTPDDDQEAAARRVVERLRQGEPAQAIRLKWQWNEALFQDVLERELILPDDVDPMVQQQAETFWVLLAQQAAMKAGLTGGMGMPGMSTGPSGSPPNGQPLPPQVAPTFGSNPGIAAAPLQLTAGSDEQAAGTTFDRLSAA